MKSKKPTLKPRKMDLKIIKRLPNQKNIKTIPMIFTSLDTTIFSTIRKVLNRAW